jgi:hypothetical protein
MQVIGASGACTNINMSLVYRSTQPPQFSLQNSTFRCSGALSIWALGSILSISTRRPHALVFCATMCFALHVQSFVLHRRLPKSF